MNVVCCIPHIHKFGAIEVGILIRELAVPSFSAPEMLMKVTFSNLLYHIHERVTLFKGLRL
jgi:hypothetical protein